MVEFIVEHWLDITTTVLGLAYILLEYKASVWMWAVGFMMQALGIVLYYQKGLYADCGMEFYYLAMTVYGYFRWISSPKSGEARRGLNIDSILEAVKAEFDAFTQYDATYIFVTNEIGSGGVSENALQRKFTDLQGWMNQYVASKADEVILMVSGIALKVKSEE